MNYLKIDYGYIPARVNIFKSGFLVKKWSTEEPNAIINTVIDGMDCTGFEKIKIKKTVEIILTVFEPKNIRIVSKE